MEEEEEDPAVEIVVSKPAMAERTAEDEVSDTELDELLDRKCAPTLSRESLKTLALVLQNP